MTELECGEGLDPDEVGDAGCTCFVVSLACAVVLLVLAAKVVFEWFGKAMQ